MKFSAHRIIFNVLSTTLNLFPYTKSVRNVWSSWFLHCAIDQKVAVLIPNDVIKFFFDINLPAAL